MKGDSRAWGWSWIALIVAWVIHIADEIASDALAFYNPSIRAVVNRELTFGVWIMVLTIILVALVLVTPLVFRGAKRMKYPAYVVATLMLLNCVQHFALFVSLRSITPGTRSAPLLFAASLWVVRETRHRFGS